MAASVTEVAMIPMLRWLLSWGHSLLIFLIFLTAALSRLPVVRPMQNSL